MFLLLSFFPVPSSFSPQFFLWYQWPLSLKLISLKLLYSLVDLGTFGGAFKNLNGGTAPFLPIRNRLYLGGIPVRGWIRRWSAGMRAGSREGTTLTPSNNNQKCHAHTPSKKCFERASKKLNDFRLFSDVAVTWSKATDSAVSDQQSVGSSPCLDALCPWARHLTIIVAASFGWDVKS